MPQPVVDDRHEESVHPTTRKKLDELRVDFGKTIQYYFPFLFGLTVIVAVSLVVLVGLGFSFGRTMDATVLAASVQVAFGMVLGFVCVYIGLMMTWVGIDAAYSVKGDTAGGAFALKSASPGLLFAMGGIVLVAVSLYKKIEYQENAANLVGSSIISSDSTAVQPEPPKMPVSPMNATSPQPPATLPTTAPASFSGQIQFNTTQSDAIAPRNP